MRAFWKPLRSDQYQEHHESTPPDDGIQLPLTPPLTEERRARKPDTSDVGKVMQMFEACRSQKTSEHYAPLTSFRVPPQEYNELEKGLRDSETLGQYVNDNVRLDYDASEFTPHRPNALSSSRFLHGSPSERNKRSTKANCGKRRQGWRICSED